MPDYVKQEIVNQNKRLNKQIAALGETYEGTDPVADAQKIYAREMMMKMGYKKQNGEFFEDDNRKDVGDPFDLFGHGIKSYFTMMKSLIVVFFIISMLMMPVMWKYYNGKAYNTEQENDIFKLVTLGNLGHASN